MCAIDALGIPAMLDTDAVITSRDPHTGEPITVTVTDHGSTASSRPAEVWAVEHPEVDGVVLDRDRALELGVRCFGALLGT